MVGGRRAVAGVLAVVVLAGLSGCTSAEVDPVLWRQMAAHRDPLNEVFRSVLGTDVAEFEQRHAELIPGRWWDGESDPAELEMDAGGLVYFGFQGGPTPSFGVLAHSGTRDAESDPFADPGGPYFGPEAVYTCQGVEFESALDGTLAVYGVGELDCPADLVAELDGTAEFRPLTDFSG